MAQSTTLILLPQTSYRNATIIRGSKQPAAAYYLGNQDLQTINWSLSSFKGTIYIQASLASNPNEANDDDWFDACPPIDWNQTTYPNGTNGNFFQNLNGNFVWLRAKVSFGDYNGSGVIQYIKVSY